MRQINLRDSVAIGAGNYKLSDLLREFVFSQDWSQDEGSVAAFERITDAVTKAMSEGADGLAVLEDKDFQTLITRVKQVQFPGQVSIELSHLRNRLVLKSAKS
jgi:hypothetical protein